MTELNTGIPAKMQELTRELTSDEIEVVSGVIIRLLMGS